MYYVPSHPWSSRHPRKKSKYTQVRDSGFDNKGTGGKRETIRWRGNECALLLAIPPTPQHRDGETEKRVICSNERHKNILYIMHGRRKEKLT